MKKRYLWDDDLSTEQIKGVCPSMDVQPDDIRELFDRAESVFAHQCRVVGSVR